MCRTNTIDNNAVAPATPKQQPSSWHHEQEGLQPTHENPLELQLPTQRSIAAAPSSFSSDFGHTLNSSLDTASPSLGPELDDDEVNNDVLETVQKPIRRNVFTASSATATKAQRSYRKDLDMKRQLYTIQRHRKKVSESGNMREWQATFASKNDHVFFILQLLSEAERYREFDPLFLASVKAEQLQRMDNAETDVYLSAIEELAALRLFDLSADPTESFGSADVV